LAEVIRARGQAVDYVPALKDVADSVRSAMQPGDLVLFLGAGDITKAAYELARELKSGARTACPPVSTMSNDTSLDVRDGNPRSRVLEQLRAAVAPRTIVRPDEPLAKRTTLRVGGKADFFVE